MQILADDGVSITGEKIATILKARVPAPDGPYTASADGHYIRIDRRATTPVESF